MNQIRNAQYQDPKTDSLATDGLLGTPNSMAYRVHEIERHLHSAGSWFEKATTPNAELHVADRIGDGIGAFEVDAGNDDWGTWIQVLGSTDTPARGVSQLYFDPHEIVIEYSENAGAYFIQFARGDSGAAGYAAGNYTEVVFESDSVGQKASGITKVQTGRSPVGSKLWCRIKCPGQNTSLLKFYIGIHEYQG